MPGSHRMGDSAVYGGPSTQDASEQGPDSNLTASAISLSLCRALGGLHRERRYVCCQAQDLTPIRKCYSPFLGSNLAYRAYLR